MLSALTSFFAPKKVDPQPVQRRVSTPARPPLKAVPGSKGGAGQPPGKQPEKRPTIETIRSLEELPIHKGVVTALHGKFALAPALQEKLAAVEVSQGVYTILVTPEEWQRNQHLSLKQTILKSGGQVAQELKIEYGALRILYTAEEQKSADDQFTAENPELTARVVSLVKLAVDARATDIHICPRFNTPERTGAILFRIDGLLRRQERRPADELNTLVGYMYTKMAEEGSRSEPSFNKNANLACSISVEIDGLTVRIRYQSVHVDGGTDYVLRVLVLGKEDKLLTLAMLGYAPSQQRELDLASRKTVGAIVIAGVTGSGKSTTLKTLMTMSPRRHLVKSYSIEDPVEFRMRMVSQVNVQRSSSSDDNKDKNPYTPIMRVIMRADPDVIMAGESRDAQSCQMLQTMVQSGHQVMTTVHTSSAIEIIDRLTSEQMGLSRHTLSSKNFLSALVYQRLIPQLCSHCKLPAEKVVPEDRLHLLRSKFGLNTSKMCAVNEVDNNCPECKGTGVKGQTVAAEIIQPTRDFLRLVREGKDMEAEEYWRSTRKVGFDDPDMTGKTAFEHGLYKVSQGLIDPRHLEDSFDPLETYQVMEMTKQ